MKKLITLLLAVAGMVSTVSATVTIYVEKSLVDWATSDLYLYRWGSSSGDYNSPDFNSTNLTTEKKYVVIDGKQIYTIELKDCANFIIHNGSGSQTADLVSSNYSDGTYYWMNKDNNKPHVNPEHTMTLRTYTFSAKTAEGVTLSNISLEDGGVKLNGDYPGGALTLENDVYTYTHQSFKSSIGKVIFNQGSGQPQTGDLTGALPGENKYYISTITTNGGQGVKTNAYGYATAVSTGNLNMTSGIAYVAENMGNWAKAHTILGIKYGNPFLVWGEANTTYCFANGSEKELPCTNAFIKGSDTGVATGEGPYNYILNGNMFKAANGQNVASTKAYLQLTNQVPAGARALRFNDDEDVAGITSTTLSQAKEQVYDLQGRSVAQPTKGFYIVNGKKVIMK